MNVRPLYHHRQTGWAMLLWGTVPLVVLYLILHTARPVGDGLPPGLLPLVLTFSGLTIVGFSTLTVDVTKTHLLLRFGPGIFRRTIALDDVASVAAAATRWYDGWGVHLTPQGMLYNVGGFDAVRVVLVNGRQLRIGSDEAERLRQAIERAREARRREPR